MSRSLEYDHAAIRQLVTHLHRFPISTEYQLDAHASPARFTEQAYFTLTLVRLPEKLHSAGPVFSGLYSAGRTSQNIAGWIDGDYYDEVTFNGASLSLSQHGLDAQLFKALGRLVRNGGSLMVAYSMFSKQSRIHTETKIALDRGYPPIVTAIGFLLFTAGCGLGFKYWYFAEGGREGPEKLQGFKPLDSESAKRKAVYLLAELEKFSKSNLEGDQIATSCLNRSETIIRVLKKL
jgi:hypothetical protein